MQCTEGVGQSAQLYGHCLRLLKMDPNMAFSSCLLIHNVIAVVQANVRQKRNRKVTWIYFCLSEKTGGFKFKHKPCLQNIDTNLKGQKTKSFILFYFIWNQGGILLILCSRTLFQSISRSLGLPQFTTAPSVSSCFHKKDHPHSWITKDQEGEYWVETEHLSKS